MLVSLTLRARADVFRSTSFKYIGSDEENNGRFSLDNFNVALLETRSRVGYFQGEDI